MDAAVPEGRFKVDAGRYKCPPRWLMRNALFTAIIPSATRIWTFVRVISTDSSRYTLNPPLRSKCAFNVETFWRKHYLTGPDTYDFIFCRNLLIYLDGTSQQKILVKLHRLLAPNGLLFVGPAELPLAINNGFTSTNHRLSFACRKVVSPRKIVHHPPHASKKLGQRRLPGLPAQLPSTLATARDLQASWNSMEPAMQAPQPLTDLAKARQLADVGSLAEAAEICQAHLREYGVSAEAFYLLGLIRDASGADSQATEFYRKAVYLEPTHYEALIQWALLAKRNGNEAHAQILQNRAERIKNQN